MPKSKWNRPTCPEHNSWSGMWDRCICETASAYPGYGGRGITVCERWRDFFVFCKDMGRRPPGTSIDRIDVNGNYEPDNCRWATATVQTRNRRYLTRYPYKGEMLLTSEICEREGIHRTTFFRRMANLANVEEAVIASRKKLKTGPKGGRTYGKRYEYKGEQLRVSEICEREGINRMTFTRRMKEVASAEEAVAACKSHTPHTYDSSSHPEGAVEDAMSTSQEAKLKQAPLHIIIDGKEYKSLGELSEAFGIRKQLIHQRVHRDGMSWEDAVTLPPLSFEDRNYDGMKEMIEIDGVSKGKLEWARHYGVDYEMVRRRVKKGMSFVEAVQKPSSRKT